MTSDINGYNHIITFVIVNSGEGSKVLSEAKKIGMSGGTIFYGRGTIKSRLLEILGLDEEKKEIVLICSEEKYQDQLHEVLSGRFHMDKSGKGIIISIPIKKVLGSKYYENNQESMDSVIGGKNIMEYEAVFTIVDRGLGHEVVDIATESGARGATIINARGSGIHEKEMFFSIHIEPEKEIVMIIVKKEISDDIIQVIKDKMNINEPGKGIMFVMDVSKTSGLR